MQSGPPLFFLLRFEPMTTVQTIIGYLGSVNGLNFLQKLANSGLTIS